MIYDINGNPIISEQTSVDDLLTIISVSRYNTYVSGFDSNPTYKKNNLTFAVITDLHADSTRLADFISYVNQHSNYIDFGILLGDNVNIRGGYESVDWYNTELAKSNVPMFATIGNHDVRGADLTTAIGKVFGEIKTKGWLVSTDFGSQTDGYWVKDFANYKVRVIGLNDYDNADALSGSSSSYDEAKSEYKWYDTAQLQWFADTLYSTPSDYSVLLFSHQAYATDEPIVSHMFSQNADSSLGIISGTAINGEPIGDILNAFVNGTSINQTYNPTTAMSSYISKTATVSKDFSSRGTGKFVGHVCGHMHVPYIATHPTYTSLNDVCVPSGSNNIYQRQKDDIPPFNNDNFYIVAVDNDFEEINLMKVGNRSTINMRNRFFDKLSF